MTQFRQGDIFFEKVSKIPKEAKALPKSGPVIVAQGEATGHHHAFNGWGNVTMYLHNDGGRYLDIAKPSDLSHEEHGSITFPEGKYRVTRQREYTPEAIRTVAD